MAWYTGLIDRLFANVVKARVNFAVRALDDARDLAWGSEGKRDRIAPKREEILKDVLDVWRDNPLARRIVELTSQYVVGSGVRMTSPHKRTQEFLDEWWDHRLNRMDVRCNEWCDELVRAGELFIIVSTDGAGMSYVRALPALEIQSIVHAENDIEQAVAFLQKPKTVGDEPTPWAAYSEMADARGGDGLFPPVMLHYCINRAVGSQRGESDLAPLLRWIVRYGAWLEDRVRLNRFRQMFLFVVSKIFRDDAERIARQVELNTNPPSPSSILVKDDSETWDVIHPKLDSFEAGEDGLAIKKIIALGAGVPLHFLAEPESSTRTTAEQSGGPTFRHFEQRQQFFMWLLRDLARVAVRRRQVFERRVNRNAEIVATGTDISSRDNASLAVSASTMAAAFLELRKARVIDDVELLRMTYRFAGEVVDVEEILAAGRKAEPLTMPESVAKPAGAVKPSKIVVKADDGDDASKE